MKIKRIALLCLVMLLLSSCYSPAEEPAVATELPLTEGETVTDVKVRTAWKVMEDLNGDEVLDNIEVLEESYQTVFENGENGGFILPVLQATINEKVYTLPLSTYRGYQGVNRAFRGYRGEGENGCVFVSLNLGGNHFLFTEVLAVEFTGKLEFLKLPNEPQEYGADQTNPEGLYAVSAEIRFDPENKAVVVQNEATGLDEVVPLSEQQLQSIETDWVYHQGNPVTYPSIKAYATPFLVAESAGKAVLLISDIILEASPFRMKVGYLRTMLIWEQDAYVIEEQFFIVEE